jgi:MFS transporter, FHS family, L-fucose permease
MAVATGLFFMVGFLTCLNDVIIPHLKSIFELSYAEAMLVQFAFFSSYFVFSFPGGKVVDRLGYKRAMVAGLLIMSVGALGFLPAANYAAFPVFLIALVVLAAGMTTVQVAANPYVTMIGPSETASSRLNLGQAFNSVGTFIAPFFGSLLILRGAKPISPQRLHSMDAFARQAYRTTEASSVRVPYIGMAIALLCMAWLLSLIKLKPQQDTARLTRRFRPDESATLSTSAGSIWKHPWLFASAFGLFTYVGAEVAIGSLLVSFMGLPTIGNLPEAKAANYLMVYWGGAMIGRFIGSAVLQRVRTGFLLSLVAVMAFGLVILAIVAHGHLAMAALLAVGICNSIMFPSIFTLGIQGLGPLTSKGSSLMIAAIVGGAIIPVLTGKLADHFGLQLAFLLPALCYVYIGGLGVAAGRRGTKTEILITETATKKTRGALPAISRSEQRTPAPKVPLPFLSFSFDLFWEKL